jgi:two-component system sensor histidine kinase AlgZ
VPEGRRALVFDACQLGVVLRAVLFVEVVGAIGAMFGAATPLDWLLRLAVLTAATLPATLAWLIVACSLKRWLGRWPEPAQVAAGMGLGALAGVYGCAMLYLAGLSEQAPWAPAPVPAPAWPRHWWPRWCCGPAAGSRRPRRRG